MVWQATSLTLRRRYRFAGKIYRSRVPGARPRLSNRPERHLKPDCLLPKRRLLMMTEQPDSAQPRTPPRGDLERRDFLMMAAGAIAVSSGSSASAADSMELARLTIAEASKKIHSREITCKQLTEA